MTLNCKRLISVLVMVAMLMTGMIFVSDTSYAGTYTTYRTTVSKIGKDRLANIKTSQGMGAFSECGGKEMPKSGKLEMVKLGNSKYVAKIIFYYAVYKNQAKTKNQKLKIQNALTYEHVGKKALSKEAFKQGKAMDFEARKYNIPKCYNFKVYRCTTKKKKYGKKMSFLVYTYELKRERIGVTDKQENCYKAIKKFGGKPVTLPYVTTEEEALAAIKKYKVDGILIPGGPGVHPKYYGSEPIRKNMGSAKRDPSDLAYCHVAIKNNIPLLGICRGQEVINVAEGGTLFQDIKVQFGSFVNHDSVWQDIQVFKSSLIGKILEPGTHKVYSCHRQAVCIIGKHIRVGARAEDGVPEAINVTNKSFILGLQFHPEGKGCINGNDAYRIFTHFIDAAKEYSKRKK